MPKIKQFSSLSKSQKYRRLKQFRNRLQLDARIAEHISTPGDEISEEYNSLENSPQNDILTEDIITEDALSGEERQLLPNVSVDVDIPDSRNSSFSQLDPDVSNEFSNIVQKRILGKSSNELSLKKLLASWAVECNVPHTTCDKLLKILVTQANLDLPLSTRTLVGTPRTNNIYETDSGKILHYGLEKALTDQLRHVKDQNNDETNLVLNLHVDGTPSTKSSKSQFWVLSGQIFAPKKLGQLPFVITVHHGFKKASVEELLNDFVEEYLSIRENGFFYCQKKYIVQIRAVICDSPARSYVTYTKGHNGYEGCGKCTADGEYVNFRMIFLELNAPKRTDQSFQERKHPGHHNGTSPLKVK